MKRPCRQSNAYHVRILQQFLGMFLARLLGLVLPVITSKYRRGGQSSAENDD